MGITESKIWFNTKEDFENKLMIQRKEGDESLIERPIRVQFIDMPMIYHYEDHLCDDFFG